MHDRTATVEDYRVLHPDQDWIPPLVTEDGDVTAVGTAHGRTIPIIGTTRPPIYDVSLHPFDGSKTRIYADDPHDIVSIICGSSYRQQYERCIQIIDQYDQLNDDNDPDLSQRFEAETEYTAEKVLLDYMRGAFVHKARAIAQRSINTEAQQDGRWDKLTAEQQTVLTRAADIDSETAPVGVLEDEEFHDVDGIAFMGRRGTWRSADVPLVVNETDYAPWQPIPRPKSVVITEAEMPDGTTTQYEDDFSELNLLTIPVEDVEEMLNVLDRLGVIDMTIRPAYPVGKDFREWYADATESRVNRNREQAARGEVPDLPAPSDGHSHSHDHDHDHDDDHDDSHHSHPDAQK